MIIIPREKPVVESLNSYYLKLDKLLEHYRGVLESGSIYFYAPTAEAAIFFDDENVLNGVYQDDKSQVQGQAAIDLIFQTASQSNFSVSVYRIQPDRLYYWANLSISKDLYSGLSSEFADLEGLIKKMENENLTGYIDVELKDLTDHGLLFFYNGEMIGGGSIQGEGDVDRTLQYRDELIKRCREQGGMFNVRKTELANPIIKKAAVEISPESESESGPAPVEDKRKAAAPDSQRVLQMLKALLTLLEAEVRANKKIRTDFETLLNRKFMEKVDKYDFLDPFAADFRYSGGELDFTGRAPQAQLVAGVVECVREMVSDLGIGKSFRKSLLSWQEEYGDEVQAFRIEI